MWHELAVAFCLVLVIEGMMPFLAPNRWRKMLETIAHVEDSGIRIMGLISMLVGIALLYLIN